MKHRYATLIGVSIILLMTISCNLPGWIGGQSELDIETAVEQTLQAASGESVEEEGAVAEDPAATKAPPTDILPSDTPQPSNTPTVTATFTPSVPMVSVTQNTNCRTGPGTVYDLRGALLVGERTEVVARSSIPNYVIVDNPDNPGTNCWLWMQYGQIEGSTDGLPVLDPPPTPTPQPSPTPELNFNLSMADIDMCGAEERIFISIQNTGAVTIESIQLNAKNQDSSETEAFSTNGFGGSPDCISLYVEAIAPGNTGYTGAGFTPPIGGDTVTVSIKACAGNGQGEPCRTKQITINVPSPSNASLKENFEPIDQQEILKQIAELPITAWNYRDSDRPGRHIGPMAQDFNDAFGVGQSEQYINAIDSYGVALAAIQALNEISEEQAAEIDALVSQNEALSKHNAELEARLTSLEAQSSAQTLDWIIAAAAGFIILCMTTVFLLRRRPMPRPPVKR